MKRKKIVITYDKAAHETAAFRIFKRFSHADFIIYDTEETFPLPSSDLSDKNTFHRKPFHRILAVDPIQKKLQIMNDRSGCVFSDTYDKLFRYDDPNDHS